VKRRDSHHRGERRYDPYPRRRRSRSKSPPLNYDDPPSNEGVELFPSKVLHSRRSDRRELGSRSRSPDQRRSHRSDPTIDLFPDKVTTLKRPTMDSMMGDVPQNTLRSGILSVEDRLSPPEEITFLNASKNTVELFPSKVQKSLEERISQKSLAERIQEDGEGGAREMFPELLRRGGGGRQRRKAEDHF